MSESLISTVYMTRDGERVGGYKQQPDHEGRDSFYHNTRARAYRDIKKRLALKPVKPPVRPRVPSSLTCSAAGSGVSPFRARTHRESTPFAPRRARRDSSTERRSPFSVKHSRQLKKMKAESRVCKRTVTLKGKDFRRSESPFKPECRSRIACPGAPIHTHRASQQHTDVSRLPLCWC